MHANAAECRKCTRSGEFFVFFSPENRKFPKVGGKLLLYVTGVGRKGSRGFPTAPLEKGIPVQRALNTNHIYKSTVSACFSLVSDAFSRVLCVWRAVCRVCLRVCSRGLSRMFAHLFARFARFVANVCAVCRECYRMFARFFARFVGISVRFW